MQNTSPNPRHSNEGGYALLMAIFLIATMILVTTVAVPPLLTEGRREMEKEMVFRGEQYARAVGLYYRKFGKYPTKVEDLTRQTNGVRFLRQAYTDPMNKEDGSWRFIYVGPNGQLIGSVRQVSLLQSTLSTASLNGPGIFGGGLVAPGPPGQTGGLAAPGGGLGVAQGPGADQGLNAPGQPTASAASLNPSDAQPQPLSGNIIGGNIIGVGSKIQKPSFRVYQGGDTYQKWEFIWNPVGVSGAPGQAPANPNANPTGLPGAVPLQPAGPQQNSPFGPGGNQPPGGLGPQQPGGFGGLGGPGGNTQGPG